MSLTTLTYIAADLTALTVLVGALYAPRHSRKDLMAAYIGVNVGVLAVTLLLSTSDNVGAGLGLGLFGVLSIIRLRSSSLAQGEVAYFFAALALGLLGGIESHIIIVAILMALILASLWVGDHPALMRRNRNQTVTIDRAISDEDELVGELEDRRRPHAPVEVVVQHHLGQGADGRLVEAHSASSRCTVSGAKAGVQIATYSAPSGPVE